MSKGNEIWGRRLKEARQKAGLSQKELGILAGLDQFVASPRINRYELGVHKADFNISTRLASILKVPTAYFYTDDDKLAEIMIIYQRLSDRKKAVLLKSVREMGNKIKYTDSN